MTPAKLLPGENWKLEDGDEEMDRVRADLDRARSQVLDAVESLRLGLRHAVDWRGYVRRWPVPVLLGGFAAGYVLARIL